MKISEVHADMAPGRKLAGQKMPNKGVRAEWKARHRRESEEQAVRYQEQISRIMYDHNVPAATAKVVLQGVRLVERAKANR